MSAAFSLQAKYEPTLPAGRDSLGTRGPLLTPNWDIRTVVGSVFARRFPCTTIQTHLFPSQALFQRRPSKCTLLLVLPIAHG
jgi:hypothetical protein